MKNLICKLLLASAALVIFPGFTPIVENEKEITGAWTRISDKLRIEVKQQDSISLHSFIRAEGDERFPCDVSGLPIYKNIVRLGPNTWSCDFLVVTMGSCRTDYEQGKIYLTRKDQMEITCPGFGRKVYSRVKPRYSQGT